MEHWSLTDPFIHLNGGLGANGGHSFPSNGVILIILVSVANAVNVGTFFWVLVGGFGAGLVNFSSVAPGVVTWG
jgi:hypothetical protein